MASKLHAEEWPLVQMHQQSIWELFWASSAKRGLVHTHSYENKFTFACDLNDNLFSYEIISTRTHFEKKRGGYMLFGNCSILPFLLGLCTFYQKPAVDNQATYSWPGHHSRRRNTFGWVIWYQPWVGILETSHSKNSYSSNQVGFYNKLL